MSLVMTAVLGLQALTLVAETAGSGETEVVRWPQGKKTTISITYDGGTINQFKVALPLMERLGFAGTFFIVTGDIPGSRYLDNFIGRPVEAILGETAAIPIRDDNFFERATALRYLPYREAREYHTRAGDLFELGKVDEAHKHIAEAYEKIRAGQFQRVTQQELTANPTVDASWDTVRAAAARGHEFASHSITHPQPAICDEANLRYELEKSKEELLHQLGPDHTFSCEWPHGSANERVLELALKIYPALRNRMPADYLEEINRWSKRDPAASTRELVQWQRGPKTSTTLTEMKGWVDTCLAHQNIWLVLIFHGVDGIGYQPKTGKELEEVFTYIKSREAQIWVATFRDVTKYIRERKAARVAASTQADTIQVSLTHSLDPALYGVPLTLRTRVPSNWKAATVRQNDAVSRVDICTDSRGAFVLYDAKPNAGPIALRESK